MSLKKKIKNQGSQEHKDKNEEFDQMAIQFTDEQFEEFLSRFPHPQVKSNKNFTQCTLRYNGERDYNKVDEFVTAVSIYKQIEGISEDDALTGLTLLLKDTASTWWSGVRSEIKTWSAALSSLRSAFAPKLQPYQVYQQLFEGHQGDKEPIDSFLCRKRALLGMLPAKRHKEEEQIDFIYGMLKMDFKRKVARTEIKTFNDLIEKARHLESLESSSEPSTSSGTTENDQPTQVSSSTINKKNVVRCSFCRRKGHSVDICRIRIGQLPKPELQGTNDQDVKPSSTTTLSKPSITCYGCGAPGVFRSNCAVCKTKDSPPKAVQFYAYYPTIQDVAKVPTIKIDFNGRLEYAHIDTAARTSIASHKLYDLMKEAGVISTTFKTQVSLADGSSKMMELLSVSVNITMGNRVLPINFTVFPDAETRTLLGIDFLQSNGIILDLGQRVWFFNDNPEMKFEFERTQYEVKNTTCRKIDFSEESLPDFLIWASQLKMLSPIPDTPPQEAAEKVDQPPKESIPGNWCGSTLLLRRSALVNHVPLRNHVPKILV
ncbi:hypothetical protein NE865_04174 [Phthorimaea operculella]|nr:hypothetical protein NE865_04174 [Phthorimaea operculella]